MRDIDLLVEPDQARRAQGLLAELGFTAPLPAGSALPGKHLAAATRRVEGFSISVEVHHNLFNTGFPASLAIKDLSRPPLTFQLNGLTAYTLDPEDMLWHLCRHAINVYQPLRLIWVVDIVGFAEKFAGQTDWAYLAGTTRLFLKFWPNFTG